MMPPNPPFSSSGFVHTLNWRPTSLAIVSASRASRSGVASIAGEFTMSRAQATDSEMTSARRMASLASLASHRAGPRTDTAAREGGSPDSSSSRVLYLVNR